MHLLVSFCNLRAPGGPALGLLDLDTFTFQVLELRRKGAQVVSETCRWRPDPAGPRQDMHHLNSIYLWKDDLLVCGFGKKGNERWDSARDGFIVSLLRGESLASGLDQPHSLA